MVGRTNGVFPHTERHMEQATTDQKPEKRLWAARCQWRVFCKPAFKVRGELLREEAAAITGRFRSYGGEQGYQCSPQRGRCGNQPQGELLAAEHG